MSVEYKVPRLLWENFESVLLAQSKRYIGELAKRLGVSEKELIKKVLPTSDSLKVIIQDTQAECNQCKAYIQHDKLTVYCRKATAYGSEYCSFHRNKRMLVIEGTNPIQIQKIKDTNTMESLWASDTTLYNSNGDIVGKINRETGKIKLFVMGA
jgi:Zn finger protein HypA/HybF involved in hydrogenase expression